MGDLIGLPELALRTGVSHGILVSWAQKGRIPATKTDGGHWRFDAALIDQVPEVPPCNRGVSLPSLRTKPEWSGLAEMISSAVADGLLNADWRYGDIQALLDLHAERLYTAAGSDGRGFRAFQG